MADNTNAAAGSTFATDDIGGVHHPRTKVGYGAEGSYVDVSAVNPLPVRAPHDTGRQAVSLLIDATAGLATEGLVAYSGFSNGVALTAGTAAFTVPAGRVFRITSAALSAYGTAASTLRARVRAAAAVSATSPHYLGLAVPTPANGGGSTSISPSGDGLEIPGGLQVGLTVVGLATQTFVFAVQGFTYVP